MKNEINKIQKWGIYRNFFKRCLDIFMSGLALILLSPVIFVVWMLVRFKLGGPSIFVQLRTGKNGKPFKFFKFRSMSNAKDEHGDYLPDEQRITKFGKFLRKSSLDELPQLWNIFKGDMSFIGPRPKQMKDSIFYGEDLQVIYGVRPGLTGLAQVNGRNEISWQDGIELDKKYASKVTFFKDLKIFFQTFVAVFKHSKSNSSGTEKRDHYYADFLLKNKKINETQYKEGFEKAIKIENEILKK